MHSCPVSQQKAQQQTADWNVALTPLEHWLDVEKMATAMYPLGHSEKRDLF